MITIQDGAVGIPESAEAHAERVHAAELFESLLKSGAIPTPPGSAVFRSGPVVWILPTTVEGWRKAWETKL